MSRASVIGRPARELLDRAAKNGYTREFIVSLRQLADHDDCDALNYMGMFHREGLRDRSGGVLVRRDRRAELEYLRRAAALGNPSGMTSLADALTTSPVNPTRLAKAERLYRRAFRLGETTAALNLACTYQNLGRHRDAVRWFRRAWTAGDKQALLPLARAELYGLGMPRNTVAALGKLRRIAKRGGGFLPFERTDAMVIMGDAFKEGWLAPRDFSVALVWLKRAAKLGSDTAKGMLANTGEDATP